MLRAVVIVCGVLAAVPALAGSLTAEEARRLVTGKLFSYNCFEGTRGAGRVFSDGSVVGTIQFQGEGPVRRAFLPAGTLRVKGEAVCASLRGMPFQPCFNVESADHNNFRGSISGLGFAYCDFVRQNPRATLARSASHTPAHEPLALRPSLTADAK